MNERIKNIVLCSVFALLLLFCMGLGLAFGSVELSLKDVIHQLINRQTIVYGLRLPRVIGAALAGGALACAGLLLQCVTGNELCAPNIVGINSGAGFAVILILCVFPKNWAMIPFGAFLGALCTTLLVLALSYSGKRKHTAANLVLAGVAVSSMLSAFISFLSLRFPDAVSSYTAFSVGGFSGLELKDLYVPAISITLSAFCAQMLSHKLSLLCLGDETAASLGVRVKALRTFTVVIVSLLCSSAVSFAGLLGFAGLIVPHIIRQIAGEDMRLNIWLSLSGGASLVILADLVGRTLFRPTELPAGIITALIGAPFFLFLLLKRKAQHDKM